MKYKKTVLVTLIVFFNFIVVLSLNSQDLSGKLFIDLEANLHFIDNKLLNYRITYPKNIDQIGEYEISNKYGVSFLTFNGQEWLCLYSEILMKLYNSDSKIVFGGTTSSGKLYDMFISANSYSASSYLVEGVKEYKPENLKWVSLSNPWVEGVDGYGIGESIDIKWDESYDYQIQTLIISNGYISYDKPYLYEKNARIKTIKITNKERTLEYIAEIADTPNFQFISLPIETKNVRIEILDVYPGTTWEDTCVSYIAGISSDYNDFLEANLWGLDNSK